MSMEDASLKFEFGEAFAADAACSTLREIGYDAQRSGKGDLYVRIENQDVESALEICQEHGGCLNINDGKDHQGSGLSAYGLDEVVIPAHIVNEDWNESYLTGASNEYKAVDIVHNVSEDAPAAADMDGFPGSVQA
ncbi:hypothetical protein OIN60_02235 [Paenibacillus sp. P96]|uniref:Uncharacterized protein n=1 Tax=Paenibacillus zeirhizosphaerae TaxID=2987519 RepID=A0ABT9FLM0_9BACL|nr:hypothetical protein [Paenibacillus sp. P96]MDP4095610.1 hypothetical protein [Paenibacillus sp. P96]